MSRDKQFSDEVDTCDDCLGKGFTIKHDLITNPGKFGAETLATYHAYHVMMDGFADDDDGPDWRVGNVICHEQDTGFVDGTVFDTEADAIKAWNAATPT